MEQWVDELLYLDHGTNPPKKLLETLSHNFNIRDADSATLNSMLGSDDDEGVELIGVDEGLVDHRSEVLLVDGRDGGELFARHLQLAATDCCGELAVQLDDACNGPASGLCASPLV